ncbi:MAG: type II toxin-antitoxin system PrlF family antitoxin [Acidobacteria bacterium]|nr:type II toxin-antitoxin system PrlF family antitoxin [Acidobacteriota bacterium]
MIVSRLTAKAQTTIPRPVRIALGLDPGDELVYEIDGAKVVLTKARPGAPTDDPFRTFREWETEADTRAYADL